MGLSAHCLSHPGAGACAILHLKGKRFKADCCAECHMVPSRPRLHVLRAHPIFTMQRHLQLQALCDRRWAHVFVISFPRMKSDGSGVEGHW